ncbi:hypothetical protein FZC33_11270 [Labrys sp. KNU-23]|uniref:hypothetical protein n=1 Tax=Labrys sp. KNU-23 TaxID=2789216 RepID=UPI0011EF8845|nr:hypothetical protein [Labrys sp. KNU-23]QEN86871.1 hypothetical protein FZC33_11270 [Labrys sp. KNU-23]
MTDVCRMILGADGNGAYGVFATLPGHDARTADPADNLKWAFRSDWSRIENLHQVGRVTGLGPSSSLQKRVDFPALPYIPFVSVRYESAIGTMQDDPWCKGNYVEQAYFTPLRVHVGLDFFRVGFPVGSSQSAASPAVPASAVYFIWKIPVAVPA